MHTGPTTHIYDLDLQLSITLMGGSMGQTSTLKRLHALQTTKEKAQVAFILTMWVVGTISLMIYVHFQPCMCI